MRRGGSGWGVASAGAETGGGLTGAGAAGVAVAIDAVRVGAASWTNDLVLRRSWTRTPAASAATRSRKVEMPSGLSLPLAFGI